MSIFIQATFVLVLFVLVRCADIAIGAARGHDTLRAIVYGVVAVLALLCLLFTQLGVH